MSHYEIDDLLIKAYNLKASDLHLTVASPPICRSNGGLKPLGEATFIPGDLQTIAKQMIPKHRYEEFLQKGEIDFSYSIQNVSRFRVNVYKQRNSIAIAIRIITNLIPDFTELKLPPVIRGLCTKPQGLILVTGPTGSGKSTTLAAMIDFINKHQSKHIITLEDPIEYLHNHQQSMVNQREVGLDTHTFANGLRSALRQDPDIILVGEMRDLETISTAITAAETGHLVLATLHTSGAAQTIDRIIDVFEPHQQGQIRTQLASVLQAVISQRLFPSARGDGRMAGIEVLINLPSVANLIRSEKTHQIANVIQTGRSHGMQSMTMAIQQLVQSGQVDYKEVQAFLTTGDYT
ncbi:type IV pilus twitching motility protein PilT [Jeotgalibacillus sp. R-1-5s-1]|uniref:type IV pilus twitching motility protein PilT n=1 Tax=Jeotgalibacillus sp. R-1-5s-1 TaxID=2555897 RepID=UPI00106AA608|nr:type IV pilus twitching motility protein PilT [Jeotgalibacillus sp. R-1-5s-1]TFD92425.1 type IV pilus twitching motility protein PilT [Jeotgalibacillus sp. R-1-5s-1]